MNLAFPSLGEISEALPIMLSLILIEGLLSVDNALAIAAMASHLPEKQRKQALRWGIIGAYFFRGLCMAFAAWIIEHLWLKLVCATYLLYLMSEHFTGAGDEDDDGKPDAPNQRGFLATILAIEFMDLSLSVDNVVAAVAMSPKLWVVCAGVFIGILALRFIAGACIKLIEKFPILEKTAFTLVGYVGFILCIEILSDPQAGMQLFPRPVHIGPLQKFIGIVVILATALLYERIEALRTLLKPLFATAKVPMRVTALSIGLVLKVLLWPFKTVLSAIVKNQKSEASSSG